MILHQYSLFICDGRLLHGKSFVKWVLKYTWDCKTRRRAMVESLLNGSLLLLKADLVCMACMCLQNHGLSSLTRTDNAALYCRKSCVPLSRRAPELPFMLDA